MSLQPRTLQLRYIYTRLTISFFEISNYSYKNTTYMKMFCCLLENKPTTCFDLSMLSYKNFFIQLYGTRNHQYNKTPRNWSTRVSNLWRYLKNHIFNPHVAKIRSVVVPSLWVLVKHFENPFFPSETVWIILGSNFKKSKL